MEQLAHELHKPARKNFKRRRVTLHGLGDLLQADLCDMSKYSRVNRGYKWILTAIDCFTKYGYAIAIKNKSGPVVAAAMEIILKHRHFNLLQTDWGLEFFNGTFKALMKKYKVKHYATYSDLKSSICERFNRTLKANMYKQFTINNNHNWIDILDDIVTKYNNTKHSTIGMKPIDVGIKHENKLLEIYKNMGKSNINMRKALKVEQIVRIANKKNVFSKSYLINWSEQLYKIIKVQSTKPTTYLIADYDTNEPISGGFYREELQPTKLINYFRIDKIKRKRINKETGQSEVLVTYKNSNKEGWLQETDLVNI
jgi:hypothetical protein